MSLWVDRFVEPANCFSARITEPARHELQIVDAAPIVNYSSQMIEVRQTVQFLEWLRNLKDARTRSRIAQRIVRVQAGLLGDAKFFDGIGELRIDCGPGYRVYFVQRGQTIIILLCGGDKSTQSKDIKVAKQIAKEV
ncbi:MAG: type II toxin-antitoxin system RelE/ParE family toxin [Allorhizobium sp.]